MKIPDGLTIKVTTNVREKTTRVLAYRKGGFRRAYRAVLPMCDDKACRPTGPHFRLVYHDSFKIVFSKDNTLYHLRDVDDLLKKLIKSYC